MRISSRRVSGEQGAREVAVDLELFARTENVDAPPLFFEPGIFHWVSLIGNRFKAHVCNTLGVARIQMQLNSACRNRGLFALTFFSVMIPVYEAYVLSKTNKYNFEHNLEYYILLRGVQCHLYYKEILLY